VADGNEHLSSPPPQIVQQGRRALYKYFKELAEQGEEMVYEAKLLILGDAGAGKTTLARKIEDPGADLPDAVKDSTPGIQVRSLQLTEASPAFTMHVWDFGGQEVYHATHQFFLTQKSLYILLCDGRKEEQFDYWLQMQEIYGHESRLLMIVNQKGEMQPNIPMSDLRRDYPNVQEGTPTVINLATDHTGAINLRKHIERSIRNLPQFERGERVPRKWAKCATTALSVHVHAQRHHGAVGRAATRPAGIAPGGVEARGSVRRQGRKGRSDRELSGQTHQPPLQQQQPPCKGIDDNHRPRNRCAQPQFSFQRTDESGAAYSL